MADLVLFIGAPSDPGRDSEAFSSFTAEEGTKIVLGGTACRILERFMNDRIIIDLNGTRKGSFRYGRLGSIYGTEGTLTLQKFNELFSADTDSCGNDSEDRTSFDSVDLLREKLSESRKVKIYYGRAFNPVNGIDKNTVFAEFVNNLRKSGKTPEIVNF